MSFINAVSESVELLGPGSTSLSIPVGAKIFHIEILQSGTASESDVNCDGAIIARNYERDVEYSLAYTVVTSCEVSKTGNDDAFFAISYYPRSEVATPTILTIEKEVDVLFYGLILLAIFMWFFRGIFDIKRHD